MGTRGKLKTMLRVKGHLVIEIRIIESMSTRRKRVDSKALHSELFAELSGRFSRRNEYSRDGTSSVKAQLFVSSRNFRYLGISELAITKVR